MFSRHWNPPLQPGSHARAEWPPSGVVMQTHTVARDGADGSAPTSRLLLVVAADATFPLPTSQLYPPLQGAAPFSPSASSGGFFVHRYGAPCASSAVNRDALASGCLSRCATGRDHTETRHGSGGRARQPHPPPPVNPPSTPKTHTRARALAHSIHAEPGRGFNLNKQGKRL